MSMISSLIDELRELVGDGSMEWVAGPVRASVLREAADTIWELRDDLQRTNAENAELREQLADAPKCETCEAMLDCDECLRADGSHKERRRLAADNAKLRNEVDNLMDFEHLTSVAVAYAGCDECGEYKQTMLRLFAENAKLRELCADVWHLFTEHGAVHPCDLPVVDAVRGRMRELGVEIEA